MYNYFHEFCLRSPSRFFFTSKKKHFIKINHDNSATKLLYFQCDRIKPCKNKDKLSPLWFGINFENREGQICIFKYYNF